MSLYDFETLPFLFEVQVIRIPISLFNFALLKNYEEHSYDMSYNYFLIWRAILINLELSSLGIR